MGAAAPFAEAIKKEKDSSDFIPYGSHVTKSVVRLHSGDYLAVIRVQGAAHESADVQDINLWHQQVNNAFRNIASTKVAVWSHTARREFNAFPEGDFQPGFARALNEKYRAFMSDKGGLVNDLYFSIVYRPEPLRLSKVLSLFVKKSVQEAVEQQLDDLAEMEDLIETALASLDRYEPEVLGCYEYRGNVFSEVGEFLGYLIDGEWVRCPLPRGELSSVLGMARPHFGKGGLLAIKGPSRVQYGAFLTIKEYPAITCPGILNDLLSMPFELVVSQSFTFLSKPVALRRMQHQRDRMINAGDVAESQIVAIDQAMDDLASNRFVMGVHHFALLVKADNHKQLAKNISDAGTALADAGIKWAREEIGIGAAFWAQLPGNFEYRLRMGDITSLNFAGFSAFHNFPTGRIRGAQWGHAVTPFRTTSGAQYYFNWHKADAGPDRLTAKSDPNHKELANTVIFGQSGTGKTFLQMFLLAQSMKFNNPHAPGGNRLTAAYFDKDRGAEVGIRALGGRYYPLQNGLSTGWAPLQMDLTPRNILAAEMLVRRLCQVRNADGLLEPLTPVQVDMISKAIAGVMNPKVPKKLRRLRAVLQFLQDTNDPNGLYARLSRWAGPGAPNAWLFDNEEDTLSLNDVPVVGFDVTEFLPNEETREPTIMYLFHRLDSLFDGRRVPIFFDEFGQLVKDRAFADLIENKQVTIRKQDGFVILGTQMPKQVINSSIADAVIEQAATMIFLPNPKADRDDYVGKLKLTEREFEIIKELDPKSRMFLVKQGQNSVLVDFKLAGFEDEAAVLSGNTKTSMLAARLVEQYGDDPAVWLPIFHEQRKGGLA
jgi:type IV secretion system protein VirB4